MLEFRNVTFGYQPGKPVLKQLSFALKEGSVTLLLGANGAGKSTTFRLMNGIQRPWEGSVLLHGRETATRSTWEMARDVCITFQHPSDQIVTSSVREEVAFGPVSLRLAGWQQLTEEALALFRLTPFAAFHPYDLSPAGRKLLTLASAAASNAGCLAFDEPSAGLSQPERSIMLDALATLKAAGRTLMIVSHDIELFLPMVERVIILTDGSIGFDHRPEELPDNRQTLRSMGIELPLGLRWRWMAE